MAEKPPTKSKRFFRIAKMTAKVAGNYATTKAGSVFKNKKDTAASAFATHVLNGEIIADTLGELKGAAMKVGQMATLAGDFLPPEMIEKLKILQNESPPMDFVVVKSQIEAELGSSIESLFDTFDEKPFKAASIGQVHRATLDGQELVVKVQYPGVDESCDSDLRHMRRIFKLTGFAYDKKIIDEMFEELKRMLHEELDYTNEAQNLRAFQEQHKNDPFVVIPNIIAERSSGRILTLSFEDGIALDEVREHVDQETCNLIGENIFKLFGRQLFRDHLVHGDPHPGNFAFRKDGTIVLYDFGCVKRVSERYIPLYRDIFVEGLAMRPEKMDEILFSFGVRKEGSDPLPISFYEDLIEAVIPELTANKIYDYKTSTIHSNTRELVPKMRRHIFAFQPNPELAIVDRLVLGTHNMFRIIGPEFAWTELLKEQLEFVD